MSQGDLYRDAAKALPTNSLESTFRTHGLDEAAVSQIHRVALFRDNAEAMGQLGGSTSGVIDKNTANRHAQSVREREANEKRKSGGMSDAVWLDLLNDLNHQIDWLDAQAEGHRTYFEDKYGEQWRSVLGKSILDEDEFPEQRRDETDEQYSRRIEDAIFDKIANPDGSLKDEFSDHPDADRLAIWAKQRAQRQEVEHHIDNINNANSPEAKQQAADAAVKDASIEQLWVISAETKAQDGSAVEAKVEEAYDKISDGAYARVSADSANDGFLP